MSEGCTANNWIRIQAPMGSWVVVEADGVTRGALVSDTPGMGASIPAVAHIGLGSAAQVDRITAEVPWVGTRTLIGPIDVRQTVAWSED